MIGMSWALRRALAAAAGALLLCGAAQAARARPAASLEGVVTQVVDGNRLVFAPLGRAPLQVRLRDSDAPDLCQEGGEDARRLLAEWALNKPATLVVLGPAQHDVVPGMLRVGGVDLGRRLVEEGYAWSLLTHSGHGPLLKEERMAHALGRGLQLSGDGRRPSEYRRAHGPCAGANAR